MVPVNYKMRCLLGLLSVAAAAGRRFGGSASVRPPAPSAASDLRDVEKTILVMTTASVPWLTGTAINPLLRCAHLAKARPPGAVTLFLPWLEPERQEEVYGPKVHFADRAAHAKYVVDWVRDTAKMPDEAAKLRVAFYDGHYHRPQGSIYPMGLTVEQLSAEAFARFDGEGNVELGPWSPDAVVLEEPEHLNWYSFVDGARSAWRQFPHVVGIVHTHYVSYAATERACGGPL